MDTVKITTRVKIKLVTISCTNQIQKHSLRNRNLVIHVINLIITEKCTPINFELQGVRLLIA